MLRFALWLHLWWSLLIRQVPVPPWRILFMSVTVEKLTEEFQSFLNLDAAAKAKSQAYFAAKDVRDTTIDAQEAIVSQARAAADLAIAEKQALLDTAEAESQAANQLAEKQKYYFGGLLGITAETEDPTP